MTSSLTLRLYSSFNFRNFCLIDVNSGLIASLWMTIPVASPSISWYNQTNTSWYSYKNWKSSCLCSGVSWWSIFNSQGFSTVPTLMVSTSSKLGFGLSSSSYTIFSSSEGVSSSDSDSSSIPKWLKSISIFEWFLTCSICVISRWLIGLVTDSLKSILQEKKTNSEIVL